MSYFHPTLGSLVDRQEAQDLELQDTLRYEIMQFKYDGIWINLSSEGTNDQGKHEIRLVSRNGLEKERWLLRSFPFNTVIAGEFMFGTQWSKNPEREGKVYAYDLLMLNGEDLRKQTYLFRYSALKDLIRILDDSRLVVVPTYNTAGQVERVLKSLKDNRAFEGLVFRNWSQSYFDQIGRIKIDVEDDYVVTNVLPGEGKHAGRMGALALSQYVGDELVEIMTCGGGFSDDQRESIWNNPSHYLGRVVRAVGRGGRFASGALRHPNFVAFRDDKSPLECRFIKQSALSTKE